LRCGARRRGAILLLIGAATVLAACGEEEPATTAQAPEAQGAANPETAELEAGASEKANQKGNRPKRSHGDEAREPAGKADKGGPKSGGPRSGGGNSKGGAGQLKPSAEEELEAAAQELLQGGQGGRPGKGDSGLGVPPKLLDQGGKPANPLKDLCLDPDKCPGVTEGPG